MSAEEEEFQRKYIDIKAVKWPEIDPIEHIVKSGRKEYKIANYRYPAQVNSASERKGIIFFQHGHRSNCKNYAYVAKHFAD